MKYYLFFLLVILSSDVFAFMADFGHAPSYDNPDPEVIKNLPIVHWNTEYTASDAHWNRDNASRIWNGDLAPRSPLRTAEEICYSFYSEMKEEERFHPFKNTYKYVFKIVGREITDQEHLRFKKYDARYLIGDIHACEIYFDLSGCLLDDPEQTITHPSYCEGLSGFIDKWMRPPKEKEDDCNARGAPAWHIDRKTMTMNVRDIPLWYQPALGDEIKIDLNYKTVIGTAIKPFGNKWSFNYNDFLVVKEDEKQDHTKITIIRNGYRTFFKSTDNQTFTDVKQRTDRLIKVNANNFKYLLESGELITFSHKASQEDSNVILMTQKTDIHGNTITFDYDKDDRMIGITDGLGKRTALIYNPENLVTRLEDPFGRGATFEYDQQSNLTSLTDMQGYTTKIGYDDNQITFIEDAKGVTSFTVENPTSNENNSNDEHHFYPPPGGDMGGNYRITVTNPNSGKEEYFYKSPTRKEYGQFDPRRSWHVAPNNYIEYSSGKNNADANKTDYQNSSSEHEQLNKIIYPDQSALSYEYDKKGNITQQTNHLGETHKYTYNSKGKYLTVTNPLGQVTTYTYYPNDLDIKTITSANGSISYEYNDRRQVTKIAGNGQVIRYTYLDNGKIDSVTNALNQVTQYHYNDKHRLHSIKVEGKTIATYEYDNIGRKIAETDLHGRKTTYAYNNIDTLVKITYPGGRTISREYNTCPRMLEAETLPGDRRYKYEYDAAKQLTSKTDPLGGKVSYERDKNGNITTLIDKNQNRTSYKYNLVNQKTELTYADGTALKTTYDKGRITAITNGRDMQTTYGYNDKEQLSTISYTDEIGVSFVYHNGQLIEVTDAIGTHKYSYDNQGRLKGYDSPWNNDVITYSYDLLGRTTALTLNGKPYAKYKYDILGRLTQVNDFTWDYDDTTPAVTLNYPNGIKHTTTLDEIGDIANRNYTNEDITALNIDYGYNKAGELISEKSNRYYPFSTWFTLGLQKISQYNPLNQLITQDDLDTPLVYDADGNLIEGYLADKTPFTASYDINNQLTSIRFKRDGIDYEERFRYFYTGMLASYELKENGKRTHYRQFLRLGTIEIQERNAQDQVIAQNLWNPTAPGGIGGLLERTAGEKQYYHYDHNGNPVQTVNAKGEVTDNLFYTPFGELISGTINHVQPFGHSTKRGDFKSGLLYFGYRFYVPHMERWLNRDPIGTNGGLNIYGYVEQNPIMYVDHFGLFKVCRRPLSYFDSYMSSGATGTNLGIFHEHGFYEDGTGDNTGFTKNGLFDDRQNFSDYKCNSKSYDDNTMRQAEKKIANKWKNGYNPLTKNCQDYTDALIDEYNRIKNPPICRLTRRGWRCN
jgi:RHS repeat-associated protein